MQTPFLGFTGYHAPALGAAAKAIRFRDCVRLISSRASQTLSWITKLLTMGRNGSVLHRLKSITPQLFIRKSGFTLVEILIVLAIIGLLAVIAIPQFISYRSQAVDAQLQSDLRNAAVAVESYFTKNTVYPSSIAQIEGFGFQPSAGVTLTLTVVTPSTYTITAAKPGGTQPSYTFNS